MKLKKVLSIALVAASLAAIPYCFNLSAGAVNTENGNVNDVNSVQKNLVENENDGFSTPVPHTNVEDIRRAMNSVRTLGPYLDGCYNLVKDLVKVIGDDGDISREKVHDGCMKEQLKFEFDITPQYEQSCYNKSKEYHSKLVASFFRIDESEITQQNKRDFLNMCNTFLEVEEDRMYDIIKNDIECGVRNHITKYQPKDMLKKIDKSRKKRKHIDENNDNVNSVQENLVEDNVLATPVLHPDVEDIRRAMNSVQTLGPRLDACYNLVKDLVKVIGDDGEISKEKIHNECEVWRTIGLNITPYYEQKHYNKFKEYHIKLVASFFRIDKSKITQQNKKDFLNMCNNFLKAEEDRMYDILKNGQCNKDYTIFGGPEYMLKKIDESREKRKRVDGNETTSKRFKF